MGTRRFGQPSTTLRAISSPLLREVLDLSVESEGERETGLLVSNEGVSDEIDAFHAPPVPAQRAGPSSPHNRFVAG